MQHRRLPEHEVVLLGVGHTNAHALRMWRMEPPPRARLTCVSNYPVATYSGMLPGVLAGQYPRQRMEIDLVRLCAAVGARLIIDEPTSIDRQQQRILFAHRPAIAYDILSIGIGSVPQLDPSLLDGSVITIKPMQTFLDRLTERLQQVGAADPVRVVIVGGGAGGVEITFCLPAAIRRLRPQANVQMTLINADPQIVGGIAQKTRQLVTRELARQNVTCITGVRARRVGEGQVWLDNGHSLAADIVVWATGAAPPPLVARLDLPRDDRGFLTTTTTLQASGDSRIFVVGDTGTVQDPRHPFPKAGVYAVRQGPVLWENIQQALAGKPLREFVPQRGFLKLLNTGDGRAIAEYHAFSAHARWCWKLKDQIDGRFMDKYQNYQPAMMVDGQVDDADEKAMRCLGCGSKVGGTVLSRVLARLNVPAHPQVALGLDRPDDAAVIRASGLTSVTVDYFAAPLDDPYLVGRIAALNAASDSFAMGAAPIAALATVALPYGSAKRQEDMLYELMTGGLEEWARMGATLAGGHTVEGPQLAIGFTVVAAQPGERVVAKEGLKVGDRLALTKPLGSGILLAAHMRAECRADWYQLLIDTMLNSNQPGAAAALHSGVTAMTDVTGFGLAGHLREMLVASGMSAKISLAKIPLLPGVDQLIQQGTESTLAPANRDNEAYIDIEFAKVSSPQYAALFDPQTAGGLLLGVPAERVGELEQSWPGPFPLYWIGEVIAARAGEERTIIT